MRRLFGVVLVLSLLACAATPSSGLPDGFAATQVISGLDRPTAIRFGPDGRAWVAEQAGRVKVFAQLTDAAPAMTADFSDHVLGRNNRGLLGLAPDLHDPTAAFVLYTFPAPPGTDSVTWNDEATNCPDGTTRSCVSTGILSHIAFDADGTFRETVLVRGWCHHHASHAPNDLAFGPDGALYVSAGEGSVPELPLDDGTWLPESQRCNAGAFAARATPEDRQPTDWLGSIVRFAAADLAAVNSGEQVSDWLADRATIVAYGLRNPFRMTFRPGSPELWLGDPGWSTWEEIDVVTDATDQVVEDFGWPCREGPEPASGYSADPRCAAITQDPSLTTAPWLVGRVGEPMGSGDGCGSSPSAVSGIAFGPEAWPSPYGEALFFADYSRACIYVALADPGAEPDPLDVRVFMPGSGTTVDLTLGPDGRLYAVDFGAGVITAFTAPPR